MISVIKKKTKMIVVLALLVTLIFAAGCSKNIKPENNNIINSKDTNISDTSASENKTQTNTNITTDNSAIAKNEVQPASDGNVVKISQTKENEQEALLGSMKSLAKQGKIINSEFPVNTTVIDTVEKRLGKPDKTDWVPAAKGNYAVFSKYNVVFGFNKGSQIFEARSFDSRLKKISLSMVKKAYGTPAYDVKVNGEEIIGYVVSNEFKMLLVFPKSSGSNDPLIDHYSVLYPKGTVNLMADDPGRQW